MAGFDAGDIVTVPYPYADPAATERRPAVVVAAGDPLEDVHGLLWVAMVTSAENAGWPDDLEIADFAGKGLPGPSVIRPTKIATVSAVDAVKVGELNTADRQELLAVVGAILRRE